MKYFYVVIILINFLSFQSVAQGDPYILFWSSYYPEMKAANYYTPHRIPEADVEGMQLMKWSYGIAARKRFLTSDAYADYWYSYWLADCKMIAIDEFGSIHSEANERMSQGLKKLKERAPDLFVAIWLAGGFDPNMKETYAVADLIIAETYSDKKEKKDLDRVFGSRLAQARKNGVSGKTIMGLGINDQSIASGNHKLPAWANTLETLESQIMWIRKNAPEMPGIAFFASKASKEMVLEADRIAGEYFPLAFRKKLKPSDKMIKTSMPKSFNKKIILESK